MNMSLTDLRYFVEVAGIGNLTKAAKILGISQPSVSSALQRVEREVGAPLLVRSKTGVRLTKAGMAFQARAKELIVQWEQIGQTTRERYCDVTAKYLVGCHPALGLYILPRFLPGLLLEHPLLDIELTHGASREITEAVIDFRLDFGIVVDPRPHPDLVIRRLGTDTVCFAVGKSWRGSLTEGSFGDSILVCDQTIYQTQLLLKELAKKKLVFRRYLYTSRLDIVSALVQAGTGVGILPLRAASAAGSFIPVPTLPRLKNNVCLIYRREAQGSPASRQIARYVESKTKEFFDEATEFS